MFKAVIVFILACLPLSALAQMPDKPGQIYDLGDIKLHMYCLGASQVTQPTVIFDAGLGGFSLEWLKVQRLLENDIKSCAYDRAGYGWSQQGPSPRTTSQINDEFERLLLAAELKPPYILVGHSFGGYNVQYFAKANPDDVAGVVLIDSSHPDQAERIPDVNTGKVRRGKQQMVTFLGDASVLEKYPEDVRFTAGMLLSSRQVVLTQQREFASFTYSASEVNFLASDFPDVPLVVVTRGQQQWSDDPLGKAREEEWNRMQDELTRLSSQGRQIHAELSGHMVHMDQPELVADIIREMMHGR